MARAAYAKSEWLKMAREVAIECGKTLPGGLVTADDVGMGMLQKYGFSSIGPASGSIFKVPYFRFLQWVPSDRVTSHRHHHGLYQYIGGQ